MRIDEEFWPRCSIAHLLRMGWFRPVPVETAFALLLGAVLAVGLLASVNDASAADECLSQSGPTIMLSQAFGFTPYRVGSKQSAGADKTKYDARAASWSTQTDRNPYPVVLNGPDSGCWAGGTINGTNDPNTTWGTLYSRGNSAAILWGNDSSTTNLPVTGVRIDNAWDAFRPAKNSAGFMILGDYVTHIRDDCVENDSHNSGLVSDSLFDGCFTGFSSRDTGTTDYTSRVWTIQNSLVRIQAFPYADTTASGRAFKWRSKSVSLKLYNNVFYVETGATDSHKQDPFGDLKKLALVRASSGNVIVWAGQGAYPWPVPKGFTVTTDKSVWGSKRAAWFENHPEFGPAPDCSCS